MKLKQKKILIIIMFLIIVILFVIIFKDFFGKTVYANTENSNIRFSNAMNIDIEEIVKQNSKINLEQIVTEEINLEYITQYENNNELPLGVMQVIQEGRTGKQQITKKITVDQSGEKHEEEISSIIVRSPANKIVQVGTNKNKKEYKISKNSEVYVTSDSAEVKKENNYESSKITTLIRNTVLKVEDGMKMEYFPSNSADMMDNMDG